MPTPLFWGKTGRSTGHPGQNVTPRRDTVAQTRMKVQRSRFKVQRRETSFADRGRFVPRAGVPFDVERKRARGVFYAAASVSSVSARHPPSAGYAVSSPLRVRRSRPHTAHLAPSAFAASVSSVSSVLAHHHLPNTRSVYPAPLSPLPPLSRRSLGEGGRVPINISSFISHHSSFFLTTRGLRGIVWFVAAEFSGFARSKSHHERTRQTECHSRPPRE